MSDVVVGIGVFHDGCALEWCLVRTFILQKEVMLIINNVAKMKYLLYHLHKKGVVQ